MDRGVILLIFLATVAYLCLFRKFVSMDPDEGIILQGAERILHGEMLYRDFFSYFTPGSYYLYALIFKIFGSSMMVARTLLAIYGGLFSVFTYVIARRVCSRGYALFCAYLVTITCLPWRFLALHNWDSTLGACAAVYCSIRFLESRRAAWILGAGSFASVCFLFEQSKGGGLILGMGLGFASLVLFDQGRARLNRKQWAMLAAGLLWPLVATSFYFGVHHAFVTMVSDWLWPLRHYSAANSVAFGYQNWSGILGKGPSQPEDLIGVIVGALAMSPSLILPTLPIVSIFLGVYWMFEARAQRLGPGRAAYYIFMSAALAGLLLSVIIGRADALHFVYLIPLLYPVLGWILEGKNIRGGRVSSFWQLMSLALFLTFTATGMAFLTISRQAHTTLETRRGTVLVQRSDSVVEFTQAHVPAGSRILVYPYLPIYYFLTGTFSPTHFEYLQPGMHTPSQQAEVIREISSDRTETVLFELGFSEKIPTSWPNTPIRYVLDDPVADFIAADYHSCKALTSAAGWHFLFMVPKDLSCPDVTEKPDRQLVGKE